MKSQKNNILLITSANKNANGIGTLFLRDIFRLTPDITTDWHTINPFMLGNRLTKYGKTGSTIRSLLVRIKIWHTLRLYLFEKILIKNKLKAIEQVLQNKKIDTIVLTTSTPELILIGKSLAEKNYNIRVIIWDAPEYLISNLRLKNKTKNKVLNNFDKLMYKAEAAAVVSEEMLDRYSKKYNIPTAIVRHGTASIEINNAKKDAELIKIVFAGSLYSKNEWNAFVKALDLAEWRLCNRTVRLVFIGNFPLAGASRPKQMEIYPPVSHSEALQLMSKLDIGYLPYWIDPLHETVARTSFPGKLTAYASAGLDIFHHGPNYSSVTKFLQKFPFGISCNSLDPNVIRKHLEKLSILTGSNFFHEARKQSMTEELSDAAMIKAFRNYLSMEK